MHARRPRIQVTDRFRAAPSSHRGEARKVVDMEITSRSLELPERPAGLVVYLLPQVVDLGKCDSFHDLIVISNT
ncbi:hypothetical protein NG2371_01940 [Nocardia gamkensis]|nr:hypothetical protein [Nocardia gamkensis]